MAYSDEGPRFRLTRWFKYERLQHYPELKAFKPADALKRLEAYEREERSACQPWLTVVWIFIVIFAMVWVALLYLQVVPAGLALVVQAPGLCVQYVLHRRIARRVKARVAAEIRDGKLPSCIECGYDLRASAEHCPECGAPVRASEWTAQ